MSVENYPMYFDLNNTRLRVFGNQSDSMYVQMGYSEATAFSFVHIREFAEFTNPSLIGDTGEFKFIIKFFNELGDPTYFFDKNQQIYFERPLSLSINTPTIEVHADCHFRLGILTNPELKTTHSGCQIMINGNIGYNGGIVAYGKSLELYSCDIKSNATYSLAALISRSSGRLYNSTLQRGAIYSSDIDVYNVNIIDSLAVIYYAKPNISNLNVYNCSSVTRVRNAGAHDVLMRNSLIQNCKYMVTIYSRARDGVKAEFIDCISDIWGSKSGAPTSDNVTVYVLRKNTVNIVVKDENGNTLDGVQLVGYNGSSKEVINTFSKNGKFDEFTLTIQEWRYSSGNINESLDYNDFTFHITKAGFYEYNIKKLKVLSPINYTVILKSIIPKIYYNHNYSASFDSDKQLTGRIEGNSILGFVPTGNTLTTEINTESIKSIVKQENLNTDD